MKSSTHAFVVIVTAIAMDPVLAQPQLVGVEPYRATYDLFEGEKSVGSSEFTLRYDAALGRYTFESRSRFRGLLRFAAPRPVVERSEFVLADSTIRPVSFTYEDGTRRGRRNVLLRFDWRTGRLTVQQRDELRDLELQPDTLDRASVRVAIARDVASARRSGTHAVADPDVIRAYDYIVEGTETIDTAIGELSAHRIRQQRNGSSRHTLIWLAPSLGFVMLRMEQHRPERDPVSFAIQSLDRTTERSTRRD